MRLMGRRIRYQAVLLYLVCGVVVAWAWAWARSAAWAQTYESFLPVWEVPQENQKKIAFMPKAIPIYLELESKTARDIDVKALKEAVMRHARAHRILNVLDDSELRELFEKSNLDDREAFGQAEIDIAYAETYAASLNYDTALTTLERVLKSFEWALARYFEPKLTVQALQMYAYTLLSRIRDMDEVPDGEVHAARLAFLEFIRLAPHVVLMEGRQPKDRVQFYKEARALFMENVAYRQTNVEEARRLADQLDIDVLVFLRIVQKTNGSFDAEIDFYDREADQMTYEVAPIPEKAQSSGRHHLGEPGEPISVFADAVTLKLENLYACLKMPPPILSMFSGEANRIYLELNFAYFGYTVYETSSSPQALGAQVRVSYMFTENFFVQGYFSVYGVFQDKSKDIYDSFEVLRAGLNVGISADFHWVRPYLSVGIEFGYMTPFSVMTSVACKAFGSNDIECAEDDVQSNKSPELFGFDVTLGVNFGKDPLYLVLEGALSLYIVPDSYSWFTLPLGMNVGVQYRF